MHSLRAKFGNVKKNVVDYLSLIERETRRVETLRLNTPFHKYPLHLCSFMMKEEKTMRTLMISAAALALTAGLAAANPGTDQLAAQAGVSANDYTQTQLIQLLDAQRNNDDERANFILSQAGQNTTAEGLSTDAQLAAAAGVEPGRFTINELQLLIEAKRDNDTRMTNFILSGQNRADGNVPSVVTPGQAQLAALLGVNASDYSLAELTKLYADRIDNRS